MQTSRYLAACGLTPETIAALTAIRAGRHAARSARRGDDARAERAARRAIDAQRRAIRETARAYS